MNYKDLGNRVRTARRNRSWTQEELAEKVGISASFLGHIERGTRVASLETFVALCNVLEIVPEYLLCRNLRFLEAKEGDTPNDEKAQLLAFLQLAMNTVNNWNP